MNTSINRNENFDSKVLNCYLLQPTYYWVLVLRAHAKMRSGANRHWSVLITWLIRILSLFPAVCIQQSATPTLSTIPNHIPNPNPKRNPTVITDPQIGRRDPQIVTIQIRHADPLRILSCPSFGATSESYYQYENNPFLSDIHNSTYKSNSHKDSASGRSAIYR